VLVLAERVGGGERLRAYLAQQGFAVKEMVVGPTTDWLARLIAAPPGAVVLGQSPDSERGWETLRVLKSHPATRDIPVLFYSLMRGGESGAALDLDWVAKPVGAAELARALDRQGLSRVKEEQTILVVDDEPGVLEMNVRIARSQSPSCRVLTARDGREALALIRQERPDLVLLDLMMPELDGFGVLEGMQQGETTRDIPVIVLTGQVLNQEDVQRLSRGVAAVLGKGLFTEEETLAHIAAALARRRELGSEPQRLVRRVVAYIQEHYAEPVSLDQVAGYFGMSASHLSRCFHQEMGVPFKTYLTRYRLNRAKELLADGRMSVTEVAVAVGFSSIAHFSRLFRREMGVSPARFRQGVGSRE
jgi:AraC-like DNA-binding protein